MKTKVRNGIILYNEKQYLFKKIKSELGTRYLVNLPSAAVWYSVDNLKQGTKEKLVYLMENENIDM